ncbi:TspO/MBR family protein [Nocardioides zhouii]|uniref:TspO/MBR family protein n=1 Tax=Nocardioides zhouii TaxID=1168729 RepID=UPI001F5C4B19|nr:TspO/MBR family protein [Nocardioides zhouii]
MTSRDLVVEPATRPWWTLVPFIVAVAAVAGVGGLAAAGSQATYRALELPAYAPPSWLFGPVWSVLYVMIGVAGWLLWRAGGWDRVMWLWVAQLLLNLAWTPLFFAADLYTIALVEKSRVAPPVQALRVRSSPWRPRSRC